MIALEQRGAPTSPALPGRRLVLVATDGSPIGTRALDHALDLVRLLDARLCVLHVLPDPLPCGRPELYDVQLGLLRRGGEAVLAAARRRLRRAGADFLLPSCRGRSTGQVIVEEAARLGAAEIVLGSRGRVAREVEARATLPVVFAAGPVAVRRTVRS